MAITLQREIFSDPKPQIVIANNARLEAFGLKINDYDTGTTITYNPNLVKPVNIRGKHQNNDGLHQVFLYGKRTSLEFQPTITGNTKVIQVRRGCDISIT